MKMSSLVTSQKIPKVNTGNPIHKNHLKQNLIPIHVGWYGMSTSTILPSSVRSGSRLQILQSVKVLKCWHWKAQLLGGFLRSQSLVLLFLTIWISKIYILHHRFCLFYAFLYTPVHQSPEALLKICLTCHRELELWPLTPTIQSVHP